MNKAKETNVFKEKLETILEKLKRIVVKSK